MALVVLFLFSTLGFAVAMVGTLGFGFSVLGAFAAYLTLALFGPAILLPMSHILTRSNAHTDTMAGV